VTTINITRPSVTAELTAARPHALGVVAAVAGGVTLLVRLALHGRPFDLFGDEVIYTDLGRSVTSGGFPRFDGQPFFLHPPGFFYLEAGWQRLLGNQPGLMAQIYQMRMLNALLAGGTAVVLVLLAARAGSVRAGLTAGLLFALDPFCIRQNDRVLLETAMMLWVLLGYLAFASLIGRPRSRGTTARAVGAGLLLGFAVLIKDEAVLLTVLPLLAVAALRWGPGRALTLRTVGATAVPYVIYLIVVAASGHIGALWQAKTSGIQRMLGVIQTTGFHSSGGGTLSARLIAEGAYFATTYVALALAVPALVLVLRRGGRLSRMMGLLYCAAGLTLGYALTLGTLEEQELYLLVVPSLAIIPVAATLSHRASAGRGRSRAGRRRERPPTTLIIPVLVLTLSLNLATCVRWLRQPDDGFAQLLTYMAVHVPAGARVTGAADPLAANGGDVAQYALDGRYSVGLWVTPAARSQESVRYVVVPWAEVNEGYSYLTLTQVRRLVGHARPVFSFRGRTYGNLALYQLPPP
jgi:Dolichyl-phosphate-mannose-protein mannosyltransferase